MSRSTTAAFIASCALAAPVAAQAPGRLATTPQALLASPVFFQGKQIAVRATVVEEGPLTRLVVPVDEAAVKRRVVPQVFVYWKERPTRSEGEVRGQFWDLGRITPDDGRFTSYDLSTLVDTVTNGRWPAREEIYVVVGATMQDSPPSATPTVRSIAMAPDSHAGREVTVSGRFRGRNLYGDLPGPLNRSRWDFVLQSADAALWVSGARPRGRGFDLDPGRRVDTGRWLEVTGTVNVEGLSVWIEAKSMALGTAPDETPVEVAVPVVPRQPPPSVIFSAPVPEEIDVEVDTTIRVQFSRDMTSRSFEGRVAVRYAPSGAQPAPAPPAFSFRYNQGTRALQLEFDKPLERFTTIVVELREGITAADGQPLAPYTLTFTTGG
ncbi:MAG TPA: Ig-like domain-containing protein [Vicinamibacterales bacterium]|nr:Ig-like domain-containing protein [Vicinamibacterales bacterium]